MRGSGKRVLAMKVLPGEPLDGTGRMCIHLFVQDPKGLVVEPHALHPGKRKGELIACSTRGRIACDPAIRNVQPRTQGGITHITDRTDDPRAVTCGKCEKTKVYADMVEAIKAAEAKR